MIAAIVGLGMAWSLYVNGGVTIGHCVLLAMGPVALTAAWGQKSGRLCLCLLTLWLLTAAATELVVHDPLGHTVYALCRPITVALSFCGAMWAFQQRGRVKNIYVVSLVVGLAGGIAFVPTPGLSADPWKYGFGPVASVAAALVVATPPLRDRRWLSALAMLTVALLNLELGFRSEFLILFVAAVVGLLASRRGSGPVFRRCVLLSAALCALGTVVYVGYGHVADSGRLGAQQEMKWEVQSRVEGGLLLGARPEFIASTAVIEDSPLVGRGVAPQVSVQTRSAFLDRMQAIGVTVHEGITRYYFGRGMFLHSVLFQVWAETGVLALPGLLFPVGLVLWALAAAVRSGSGSPALIFSLLAGQLGWDLLFSPWPRLEGVYLGTAAAAAVVYLASQRQSGTVPPSAQRIPSKVNV
ncbi:hypothetical protein OG607_13325 [Streptomyces sp. NBC_01537]|uniref:hypothetical protein n=1 Tax=Streptomyces sp. NBC_01537 TaxID=2903896 RepID=UPI003869E7E3